MFNLPSTAVTVTAINRHQPPSTAINPHQRESLLLATLAGGRFWQVRLT